MSTKNTTATDPAQAAVTTRCQFYICPSTGSPVFAALAGHEVSEAMINVSRILDGTLMLMDRIERDGDGDASGLEIAALRLLVEAASALQHGCRRGLECQGGHQ